MPAFRLGIVGGGRMGQTHLRALEPSESVQVVAVVEPYEATGVKLRGLGLRVHSTVAEMLACEELDGVIITAPTDQHQALVEEIAASGLAMLCEKPTGLSAAQAHAAGEAAARHGSLLQIAYWRRFVPALQELRSNIASGALGDVHMTICKQWDEAPPATKFRAHSGGIFIDMGVHEIDQLRWLTGCEIVDVTAVSYPRVQDLDAVGDVDSAQALVTMSGGSAAVISLGRFYRGGDLVAVEVLGSGDHRSLTVLGPDDGEGPQLEALRLQAEAFARCAAGGPQEGATIVDAERALEAADRLSRAAGLQLLGDEA